MTLDQIETSFIEERDNIIARLGSVTLVHQFELLLKRLGEAQDLLFVCPVCPDCGSARGRAHQIGCKLFEWTSNMNNL